jgi:hypothetical protein
MKIEGKVGRQDLSSGAGGPLRLTENGAVAITSAGGKYTEAALAGRLFSVCNQAHITTSAALATNWAGLGVGNPSTSGKNYIFHEFGWAADAKLSAAAAVIGLMVATVGNMTQGITPRCAKYAAETSVALADGEANAVGTPILVRLCGSSMFGAISTVPSQMPNIYEIDGSIVIPPGYALLSYTFTAQTSALQFHFVWEEVDV